MSRSRRVLLDDLVRSVRAMRSCRLLVACAAFLIALAPALVGLHCLTEPHVWCERHVTLEHGPGDHAAESVHDHEDTGHDPEIPHHDPCRILALARLDSTAPSLAAPTAPAPVAGVDTPSFAPLLAPPAPVPLLRIAPKTSPPRR